jgi:hypothetical protein
LRHLWRCTYGGEAFDAIELLHGRFKASPPPSPPPCPAGFSGPQEGQCTECVAGKYKAVAGYVACSSCEAYTFSGTAGATTCWQCAENSHSAVGSSYCTCDAGFWGKPPLPHVHTKDVHTCTACVPGKYSVRAEPDEETETASSDANSCTDCKTGSYSRALGATAKSSCTTCPLGSTSLGGSASLTACHCIAGWSGPDGSTCVLCVAGKYKDGPGEGACVDCLAGKYSTIVAAISETSCVECAAGKYSSADGAALADACIQCVDGKLSEVGSDSKSDCLSFCPPGFYGQPGTCTPCDVGKYTNSPGPVSVQQAPTLLHFIVLHT